MRKSRFMSIAGLTIGALALSSLPAFATELAFPDLDVQLTELSPEPLRIGRDYATLELERIAPGVPAHEVEQLLGQPYAHASEGGVTHWDYNVNFPIADDTSQLVCQYKVVIGEDRDVSSTHWRRHTCEDLAQALIAASPGEAQVLTFSADVLFDFGEAELTQQGRESLREVVERLQADYQNPLITLVGHTDRIGSSDFNLDLSKRRAEAVRRYLARSDLSSASMVTEGRGEAEPVVVCRTGDRDDLKRCLQPNRRVDIEVLEQGGGTSDL